jgi:hypothetical protein
MKGLISIELRELSQFYYQLISIGFLDLELSNLVFLSVGVVLFSFSLLGFI